MQLITTSQDRKSSPETARKTGGVCEPDRERADVYLLPKTHVTF